MALDARKMGMIAGALIVFGMVLAIGGVATNALVPYCWPVLEFGGMHHWLRGSCVFIEESQPWFSIATGLGGPFVGALIAGMGILIASACERRVRERG